MLLGSASYDTFRSTRMFSGLDGLRALSVIAVLWQHTSGNPGPSFFSRGAFGVEFFFAISGFLITTLLLRERDRNGRISLTGFYIRRTMRIFPLYYLVLLTYIVLTFGFKSDTAQGREFISNIPAFATYTSNWFVDLASGQGVTFYFAWSLATEEQFYLFWPPLLVAALLGASLIGGTKRSDNLAKRSASRRAAVWHAVLPLTMLTAGIVINQLSLAAANQVGGKSNAPLIVTILASLSLPILLGSSAAILLHRRRIYEAIAPVMSALWCAPLLAAATLASLAWDTPKQLTQVCMVLLVVSICVTERTLLHPVLRWGPLAYVGRISYGIYLLHMLCANALRPAFGERFSIPLFLATTVLVVGVAGTSFRWLETPLVQLARRLSNRVQKRRAARLEQHEQQSVSSTATHVNSLSERGTACMRQAS